jgi:tetratricopeptide (TPR) repeat protein
MGLENAESLTFGELIKAFRQRAGLTQAQFAGRLEKSRRSIIDWEAGTSRPQKKGDLLDIARVARLDEEETTLLLRAGGQDPSPLIWNIPYPRNPHFTGREAALLQLASALRFSQPLTVPQPIAITGLGGIGKTQIALEYAYRFYQNYQAVLWVEASSRDRWIASYLALADLLHLSEKDILEQEEVVPAVKRWLQSQSRWLLILDDVADLSQLHDFLPSLRKGHILLTTRTQAMSRVAHSIEIDILEEESSILFLLHRASLLAPHALLENTPPADLAVARQICEELGRLPLALDQAGAYIEETKCDLAQYLQLYQAHRVALLQRRGGIAPDHPEPVATTWSLSFEQIEQRSPAAADLLRVCAFLHGDAIPEALILEMIGQYTLYACPNLLSVAENPLLLNDIISILLAYSLIRRRTSESMLSMHRLVQVVLKDAMDKETFRWWAKQMVCAVGLVFPDANFDTWPTCECFLPHALVCATLIEQEQMTALEDALLVYQTGMYLLGRLRLSEAEPLLQRAFAICEGELGASHPLTVQSLSNLATLYQLQGQYTRAESLFHHALTLFATELDSHDPLIINTLNDLAMLYHRLGKYAQAMPLLWRAYLLSRQAFGPLHYSVARCLVGLAALHQAQNELDEAETFSQQAVALSEQLLGPDAPYVAVCLNNLSIVYRLQKKYDQAEQLLTRALSICTKRLGTNDPFTAKCLGHLAGIYHLQGKESEAEPLFQQALTAHEQCLGADHPDVAIALSQLADFYCAQGRLAQAEPLLRRAVVIGEKLGATNPERVTFLNKYASLLQRMGQDEQAEKLAVQARQVLEDAHAAMPKLPELSSDDLTLTAHEVFTILDHVWNLTEKACKKQLTKQERTRVERVKQILWLLLEDIENDFKQDQSAPVEPIGDGKELMELLEQPPFLDLDERPDLRHIPGIGYVPDDFPFDSYEEMQASARLLILLRHFRYLPLSAKDQVALRKLQEAIIAWRQDWLEGPLPEIVYTGPSETAIQLVSIAGKSPFRKKFDEIQQLPEQEVLTRLQHHDDIQQINNFRNGMAQRFETIKGQLIEDLKKMGKFPDLPPCTS